MPMWAPRSCSTYVHVQNLSNLCPSFVHSWSYFLSLSQICPDSSSMSRFCSSLHAFSEESFSNIHKYHVQQPKSFYRQSTIESIKMKSALSQNVTDDTNSLRIIRHIYQSRRVRKFWSDGRRDGGTAHSERRKGSTYD